MFRYDLPPALLAEWPGSFTRHYGNMGVERTPNKSQYTKLTLEKKILPPLLPRFELATFRSRIRPFTNTLPRLPDWPREMPQSSTLTYWPREMPQSSTLTYSTLKGN